MKLAATPEDVFGKITPPLPLRPFIGKDPTGAGGISLFLSNLIILIYEIAAVVFAFMLVWGALEWILSGGNKDAVGSAQRRITNAIIGIIVLGVTFAILSLVGTFTGFSFFKT